MWVYLLSHSLCLSTELLVINYFDPFPGCKKNDSVRIDEDAKCFALFQVSAASLISGYNMNWLRDHIRHHAS